MTRCVALLRGINVGGRIIKMAELRECFERLGFTHVSTLLQSGNVVFESDRPPAELKPLIEAGLSEAFRYPAKAQVVSLKQLRAVIEAYPFGTAGDSQHDYVIFLENGLEQALAAEDCELAPGEQVAAGAGVVYWRVDKGSTLKTSFAKLLTKAKYREFNTNRNLKTLHKIVG